MSTTQVTTKGGRYVQGGGCMTVGVAGLILGGGFGSFSKAYGTAGASLLEAEVVTADGEVKIANACTNPDLFWALKGGGGGFGVVTRVTLRTHALPEFLGGVFATIKASSDEAYRRLIAKIVEFYAQALFNPHWGEQLGFGPGGVLSIFDGASRASTSKRPRRRGVPSSTGSQRPRRISRIVSAPRIISEPARHFWDPALLKQAPGLVISDDRPGAPADNIFWAGNLGRGGRGLARLPIRLAARSRCSQTDQRERLGRRAVRGGEASGRRAAFQQGTCGRDRGRDRRGQGYGDEPGGRRRFRAGDQRRRRTARLSRRSRTRAGRGGRAERGRGRDKAMDEIRKLLPRVGSYVWETDFFQPHWQEAFWGDNYARLLAVKDKYDPDGLFFLHHGVGSEDWSADGFTRLN